jgi:hypothetical protein
MICSDRMVLSFTVEAAVSVLSRCAGIDTAAVGDSTFGNERQPGRRRLPQSGTSNQIRLSSRLISVRAVAGPRGRPPAQRVRSELMGLYGQWAKAPSPRCRLATAVPMSVHRMANHSAPRRSGKPRTGSLRYRVPSSMFDQPSWYWAGIVSKPDRQASP